MPLEYNQEELSQVLKDIAASLRLLVQPQIKARLSYIFSNNEEMKAYELTDGLHSSRDIEKAVSFGKDKIIRLWEYWEKLGIVESSGKGTGKTTKRIYSLAELAVYLGKGE